MKIANADKLIHHFENTVDVKLFTVPEILTIIDTFSVEIPDSAKLIMTQGAAKEMITTNLERLMNFKTSKISEAESEGHKDDR